MLFFSRSNCKLDYIEIITLIFQTHVKIGDNIKIGVKIIEGNKERVQFYEGTILAKKNSSITTTITVRKILQGIGIERIFLIHSPKIDSITVIRS
jgi:large subunit ribosomal protein L19